MNTLENVAVDYLNASQETEQEYLDQLVQASDRAIFPLLHGGLSIFDKHNLRSLTTGAMKRQVNHGVAEMVWFHYVGNEVTQLIRKATITIGQSAEDALCRALWENDPRLIVLSAVVLSTLPAPSERTMKLVNEAFTILSIKDVDKEYYKGSAVFLSLVILLARGGKPEMQAIITNIARDEGQSEEYVEEMSRNTALKYLEATARQ